MASPSGVYWHSLLLIAVVDVFSNHIVVNCVVCNQWTSQANTSVDSGQVVSSANTIEHCLQACVDNANCTGVDWDPIETEGQRCWMSGWWSGDRYNGTSIGITHYDLMRNCFTPTPGSSKTDSRCSR